MKSDSRKTKKQKLSSWIGIAIMLVGAGIFFYPDLQAYLTNKEDTAIIQEFKEYTQEVQEQQSADGETQQTQTGSEPSFDIIKGTDELLGKIQQYNSDIYADGQEDFKDAWTVAQTPVTVKELQNGMFGYIQIPAMNCTLPLYIGASTKHMDKGAAVLGATSIPIGGENTNSVIAGHRGWKRGKYFKQIEKLSVGDKVYITNPWGTLKYKVESIDIIKPTDSDKVKIQEGKDMVTLMTCHPYQSHGKYRYVVYCVRDMSEDAVVSEEQDTENGQEQQTDENYIPASDGNSYESSETDIRTEELLRRSGAVVILFLAVLSIIINIRRNISSKSDVPEENSGMSNHIERSNDTHE